MAIIQFLKDLFELAKPAKKLFYLLIAICLITEAIAIPIPLLFTWLIDEVQTNDSYSIVLKILALTLGIQIIQSIMAIVIVRLNRRFAMDAANRLRNRFFSHLLKLPYAFFLDNAAGGQANSLMNDIDDIDLAISDLVVRGFNSLASIILFGLTILIWNPLVGFLAIVIYPLTIYLQRKIRNKVAKSSRRKVDLRENMMSLITENLNNISILKSFRMEEHALAEISEISRNYSEEDTMMETYQSALRSTATVLLIFTQFSFFVVAALMVIYGHLSLAAFLGQMLLLGKFIGPLNTIMDYGNALNQSHAAIHRVKKTLALEPEEKPTRTITELGHSDKGINLDIKNLNFSFRDDMPLIKDWSFNLKEGQYMAVVGKSGSGKTTLLNILQGLYDDYEGEILLNGTELKSLKLNTIREQMAVVFQEQILFNATVRENLLVAVKGHKANEQELWQALDIANAKDFIEELENGLDTVIGVNGIMLSGGQRQRLSLARVILRNPPLLLLDEATSALDSISEQQIQKALDKVFIGRSSIVIAHRLSTIVNADKIIVLDNHRIAEWGTHQELLEKDGIYKKLYDAQVEGFINWDGGDDE